MARIDRYPTVDDVMLRLHGTIVRFKGEPILIENVASKHEVFGRFLLSDKSDVFDPEDENLDISSPLLGNVNLDDEVFYVMRSTKRQQKQGVLMQSLVVFKPRTCESSTGYMASKKALGRTIAGLFPSFLEAKTISKTGRASAFDRYFALHPTPDSGIKILSHLRDNVGLFFPTDNTCLLLPSFNESKMHSKLSKYMEILPCSTEE